MERGPLLFSYKHGFMTSLLQESVDQIHSPARLRIRYFITITEFMTVCLV